MADASDCSAKRVAMKPIETERLVLRLHTPDELDTIYQILIREIEDESFTRDAFDAELHFDSSLAQQPLGQQFGRPAIFLKGSDRYIGFCVLMPRLCTPEELALYNPKIPKQTQPSTIEAEIGWAISDTYRNQGYATEAGKALIRYGFDELQLPRIVAFTERSNEASIRVMRKLGMQIGTQPQTDAVAGMIEYRAA